MTTYATFGQLDPGFRFRTDLADPFIEKTPDMLHPDGMIVEVEDFPGVVKTFGDYRNNAELVRDGLVPLGALAKDEPTLDMTYGKGRFWTLWEPDELTAIDIIEERCPNGHAVDFRDTGFDPGQFTRIVLDGPYRLNGTPDTDSDGDYGVHEPATWQERYQLIKDGITEAGRLLKRGGILTVKCQDQVCSGKKRWQTADFAAHGATVGFRWKDELHMPSFRDQPEGRKQVHSRMNFSTALILVKK